MYSSEPLPHFVEDYLAWLHESCPTGATFDGVHAFDDHLEDVSRDSIDRLIRDLGGFARRLEALNPGLLTETERLERPMVQANIRSRLFELEELRGWERNPQYYADLLATSLASQAVFQYAPVEERARRVLSKLRQTPGFVRSARTNVKDPPGIFVKIGLETLRGVLAFVEEDLPRAFAELDDPHLLGDLADASGEASQALQAYIDHLEREQAPRSRASFRLGRGRFERKLELSEGLTLGADRLLAIAMRELRDTQEQFRAVAGRLDGGDAVDVWRQAKAQHPAPGRLVDEARAQLDQLATFIERAGLLTMPEWRGVTVAATPRFYRWTSASMWTPGPFETRTVPAYYYITDVDPRWPADRQEEHLRDFNYGVLWSISIHEVYPGHFLHYQALRKVDSKLRKSTMFASAAFVEGWAHYCEQMVLDAGFGHGDHLLKLGQLSEALIRLSRFVVGLRLHTEDMSVEQGVRFFRDEAFLEEGSARREAERGAFDPSYVVYSAGKLALLKLRSDVMAAQGGRFSLGAFHDALLSQGTVPFWLHRRLMLEGDPAGVLLE